MPLGSEDAAKVLEDLRAVGGATVVRIGGSEVDGARSDYDDSVLGEAELPVHGRFVAVVVRTGSLEGLVVGATATVDDVVMRVADVRATGNGVMTRVLFALTGSG